MNNHMLDITPLAKALMRLVEGYDRYLLDITDTQIRDGLIQRFEFTYEISHKMIKRITSPTEVSVIPPKHRPQPGSHRPHARAAV